MEWRLLELTVVGLVSATLVVELVLSMCGLTSPQICLHIYAADVCIGIGNFVGAQLSIRLTFPEYIGAMNVGGDFT